MPKGGKEDADHIITNYSDIEWDVDSIARRQAYLKELKLFSDTTALPSEDDTHNAGTNTNFASEVSSNSAHDSTARQATPSTFAPPTEQSQGTIDTSEMSVKDWQTSHVSEDIKRRLIGDRPIKTKLCLISGKPTVPSYLNYCPGSRHAGEEVEGWEKPLTNRFAKATGLPWWRTECVINSSDDRVSLTKRTSVTKRDLSWRRSAAQNYDVTCRSALAEVIPATADQLQAERKKKSEEFESRAAAKRRRNASSSALTD
ncbi:uncharacterized protein I303_104914 [Kwoniella dejecticola CBS 10117]|uniref:Uncharacterized protein n=1 Tax=Kwoniella dejecticola CBS 10117 TaxID=1296121 RepID=A0A1A6A405_9TREE|nr:uncharacterized protein I303_05640 [Kwoniella dejecticola CBS 10117]OBR84781.1 hypothetical protein I303_05640 [Kwoniella dejecticola CBS 10117]